MAPAALNDNNTRNKRNGNTNNDTSNNIEEGEEDKQSVSDEGSQAESSVSTGSSKPSDLDKSSELNSNKRGRGNNDKQEILAHRETQHVFRLRLLVFLVLLLAAAAVSVVVFYITSNAQHEEFRTQFEGTAKQVVGAFQDIISQKVGAISALGVAAIAHGVDHSEDWPFVELSSFQQRSATARSLSGCLYVVLSPIVLTEQRSNWEEYVVDGNATWIKEGFAYQRKLGLDQYLDPSTPTDDEQVLVNPTIPSYPMFYYTPDGQKIPEDMEGPYLPVWETSPIVRANMINQNLLHNALYAASAQLAMDAKSVVIGQLEYAPPGDATSSNRMTSFYATVISMAEKKVTSYLGDPMSTIYLPVFHSFESDRTPVAVLAAVIRWSRYFAGILPPNTEGVVVVLENSCDGNFTYQINGPDVIPLGKGDLHDTSYDEQVESTSFRGLFNIADGTETGIPLANDECYYTMRVYPSDRFEQGFINRTPLVITFSVALVFVFTACMFLIYDRLVERRQRLILRKAMQSTAIVSSLFPKNVRDRLLQENDGKGGNFMAPNHRLKSYLQGNSNENDLGLQPIADLFPHTTVLFADIAGFTAWSSTRDPAQVFILLQTVYQAFDTLANRREVFKVETIGDSYVAVTGLPEPQEKHAVIMARFAHDCLMRMIDITKELEVTLGPDTGDLSMRMGLHSGPVTAGVLRGERSRFQLFGDTVNTAARMESTGIAGKIQISQTTADLLVEAGKEHWVKARKDAVQAKGKGVLNTFWLTPMSKRAESTTSGTGNEEDGNLNSGTDSSAMAAKKTPNPAVENIKQDRLVNWIVELLSDHIKHILARRKTLGGRRIEAADLVYRLEPGKTSLDEVAEVISLPKFDAKAAAEAVDYSTIEIDPAVLQQLRDYVATIAKTYRDNPFHNFEHACHVTMAVNKFLKRIVAPDIDVMTLEKQGKYMGEFASQIHDYTHGINSDPVTLLAIVLSGLIHDADHRGVSNAQLIKEESNMAQMYHNKSVAEQNSLDISWDLLMSDQFEELRRCLFASHAEMRRFRQVLVNVVLATDIFDKELNDLRKARWNKAFSKGPNAELTSEDNDLRATIVIEHIIQASDVAHTMQHWHIYRKWNERLFREMYHAFQAGRMGVDPATFWYKGELGFFDNYIIPLSRKLKECNVFGVSSDECLNYALKNRVEWEERGQEIVETMIDQLQKESAPESAPA